jgi:hypothetical protein
VADDTSLYTVPPGSDVAPGLPSVNLPTTDESPQRPHISVTPQKVEKAEKPPADTGWSSKYAKPPEEASPPPAAQSAGWSTKYAEKPPEEEPLPDVGAGEAAGRGALNALTFGAAPALSGMAQAGGEGTHPAAYDIYKMIANAVSSHPDPNVTAAYERGRQAVLRDQEAAQEQHPWAYFGGQLAGSLATPGFGAMRAGSMLGKAGAGALAGGIGGGLYGAGTAIGEGQDLSGIGRQALTGAALGAPLGGVLGTVGPKLLDPNSPGQMAAATAQRIGAPLPRGLTSDNPAITGLTAKLQSSPFGGAKIGAGVHKTAEAAEDYLGDISSGMTQGVEDRATADAIVRPALQSVVDQNKQAINSAYDGLRNQIDLNQHYSMPNTQVELGKVMADRTAAGWDKPEQGLDQFQNIVNGATFNGAHRARVDARGAGNVLVPHPGYNKSDYNRLTKAMTKDLRHIVYSAALDPAKRGEAVQDFDAAERQFGQLAERNDSLYKLVNKRGEAAIASLLNSSKEKSGNVALLNQLKNSMGQGSPDFQLIGGMLLHELGHNPSTGQFSLAKFMTEWGKRSSKAKQALFSPDHLKDLNDIAAMGKHLKGALKETNTSHTANVLLLQELMEKFGEFVGEALTGKLSAKKAIELAAFPATWGLTRYLASPAKAKAMNKWLQAFRNYTVGPTPARSAAFNEATRFLFGSQVDPSRFIPQIPQRAHGGRVWKTRHDRVKAILERHGATL